MKVELMRISIPTNYLTKSPFIFLYSSYKHSHSIHNISEGINWYIRNRDFRDNNYKWRMFEVTIIRISNKKNTVRIAGECSNKLQIIHFDFWSSIFFCVFAKILYSIRVFNIDITAFSILTVHSVYWTSILYINLFNQIILFL